MEFNDKQVLKVGSSDKVFHLKGHKSFCSREEKLPEVFLFYVKVFHIYI